MMTLKQQGNQSSPVVASPEGHRKTGTHHIKVPTKAPNITSVDTPEPPLAISDTSKSVLTGVSSTANVPNGYAGNTPKALPLNLHSCIKLVRTRTGRKFAVTREHGSLVALLIGAKKLNALITEHALNEGKVLRKADLAEINSTLDAFAERHGEVVDVWLRVAPFGDGIEIDTGDDHHTRVRIATGQVDVIREGSETIFWRTPHTKAMVMPAETGDRRLIEKYLNMSPQDKTLLIAWITYTLAHAKTDSSKYVILVLNGNEGSGKTSLA